MSGGKWFGVDFFIGVADICDQLKRWCFRLDVGLKEFFFFWKIDSILKKNVRNWLKYLLILNFKN